MKYILGCLLFFYFSTSLLSGGDNLSGYCSKITERHHALSVLMSRKWIDNEFYSKEDFEKIIFVKFKGLSMLSDGHYVDLINDPVHYEVKRITETIFESREELFRLDENEFWKRVLYVDYLLSNGQISFFMPLDLAEMDAWWRLKEIEHLGCHGNQ